VTECESLKEMKLMAQSKYDKVLTCLNAETQVRRNTS
jgi:hypothetical protein